MKNNLIISTLTSSTFSPPWVEELTYMPPLFLFLSWSVFDHCSITVQSALLLGNRSLAQALYVLMFTKHLLRYNDLFCAFTVQYFGMFT